MQNTSTTIKDKKYRPLKAQSAVDMWLGQHIRQLRKVRQKSLVEIAQACQMSVGLLSQIERGMSSVSIKSLHALAKELGVSPDSLLKNAGPEHESAEGSVARAGFHRRLNLEDKGILKEIVTPSFARDIDLCRALLQPGASSGDQWFSTDKGEQVGMVLTGALELWIDNKVVLLNAGDSFCYSSRTPRRWRNPGNTPAEVIWAISNIHTS
jgi:transcriptional regulator with XRE-family HTH domain